MRLQTPFNVRREGVPISDYPLKHPVSAGITYSNGFSIWEAAHEAGLDLYELERGLYPVKFIAKIVAWHSLHNLVKVHGEDAVSAKLEKK